MTKIVEASVVRTIVVRSTKLSDAAWVYDVLLGARDHGVASVIQACSYDDATMLAHEIAQAINKHTNEYCRVVERTDA